MDNIFTLELFLEYRASRKKAGTLKRENGNYTFTYQESYLKSRFSLSAGPEFPLTRRSFSSDTLFPSFLDRIPDKANPAYPEYCRAYGIDPEEKDEMVLLSTLGQRTASSFIFFQKKELIARPEELREFRKALGLGLRDFADLFDTEYSTLSRIENGKTSGVEFMRRMYIYLRHPDTAREIMKANRGLIHPKAWKGALEGLESLTP